MQYSHLLSYSSFILNRWENMPQYRNLQTVESWSNSKAKSLPSLLSGKGACLNSMSKRNNILVLLLNSLIIELFWTIHSEGASNSILSFKIVLSLNGATEFDNSSRLFSKRNIFRYNSLFSSSLLSSHNFVISFSKTGSGSSQFRKSNSHGLLL